jgi:hypothetical protein
MAECNAGKVHAEFQAKYNYSNHTFTTAVLNLGSTDSVPVNLDG